MRIDIYKVKTARKVLKAIQILLKSKKAGNNSLHLEHYQNCREQGFMIINYNRDHKTRWVSFSEYRSSDSIVVYRGDDIVPFQGITDEAYKDAQFYHPDHVLDAAKCCVDYLLESAK